MSFLIQWVEDFSTTPLWTAPVTAPVCLSLSVEVCLWNTSSKIPQTVFPFLLWAMAERRLLSQEDDQGSLLSRLGTDSPKPRVKFGGMFCNIEGAFENKTLNFESYSPSSARRNPRGRVDDQRDNFSDTTSVSDFSSVSQTQRTPSCSSQGQTLVYPTGPGRAQNGRREVITPVATILVC